MFKTIIIFTGFLIFCYVNRYKALKDFKEKPKNDKPKKVNHSKRWINGFWRSGKRIW